MDTATKIVVNRLMAELDELSDDDLLGIYHEANSWDGSFDFCDTFGIDEIFSFFKSEDAVTRIIYGNVTNTIDPVRCDGYGNLESISEYDLVQEARKDYLDELAEWLIDEYMHVDLRFYDGEAIEHVLNRYNPRCVDEEQAKAIVGMFSNN